MTDSEHVVRASVVITALSLLQVPYRWDGKSLDRDKGLDCSGFAQLCIRAGGIPMSEEENADTLWKTLPPVTGDPLPGDLAFYGDVSRAHHVVVVLGTGGTAIIGSNGGGPPLAGESADEYATRMAKLDAGVRIEDWRRGGARYRSDFLGFRRLPVEKAVALEATAAH